MKMKNLDIEMHNTLDITNMTQAEIETAIKDVLSKRRRSRKSLPRSLLLTWAPLWRLKQYKAQASAIATAPGERGAQGFEVIKRPQTASFLRNRGVQWVLPTPKTLSGVVGSC